MGRTSAVYTAAKRPTTAGPGKIKKLVRITINSKIGSMCAGGTTTPTSGAYGRSRAYGTRTTIILLLIATSQRSTSQWTATSGSAATTSRPLAVFIRPLRRSRTASLHISKRGWSACIRACCRTRKLMNCCIIISLLGSSSSTSPSTQST